MNKYLSDKIRILSFILVLLVTLLHAHKAVINYSSGSLGINSGYTVFIQTFFSEGIARIAVPLFFSISGYLFFLKLTGAPSGFISQYKKRAESLLLPYLLWSAWGLFFYFSLQLFPQSRQFFTSELIVNYSFAKLLNTLLLQPLAYQLWFLRDLMALVIISPLIYWMIRQLRIIPVMLLFMVWLAFFERGFGIVRNESIFFFSIGAYLAIHKSQLLLQKFNQKKYLAFSFLWIVAVCLKTILICQRSEQMALIVLLSKLSIVSGIVALWCFYDLAMKHKTHPGNLLLRLSAFSFFTYGFHEPLLTLIQKGLFHFTGATEIAATANYILAPVITIMISIMLGISLKRYTPVFYKLISGGR